MKEKSGDELLLPQPPVRNEKIISARIEVRMHMARSSGLTTQAQRPGARNATIATATLPPGSLERMVRPNKNHISNHRRLKQTTQDDQASDDQKSKSNLFLVRILALSIPRGKKQATTDNHPDSRNQLHQLHKSSAVM